jgi:hypothetical protein
MNRKKEQDRQCRCLTALGQLEQSKLIVVGRGATACAVLMACLLPQCLYVAPAMKAGL